MRRHLPFVASSEVHTDEPHDGAWPRSTGRPWAEGHRERALATLLAHSLVNMLPECSLKCPTHGHRPCPRAWSRLSTPPSALSLERQWLLVTLGGSLQGCLVARCPVLHTVEQVPLPGGQETAPRM